MLDKKKQIKSGVIFLLPLIISNILPLITYPIFTRILTKADYGVLALAYVYAIFANGLANLGMNISYDRNFFKYREDDQKSSQLLYSSIFFVTFNIVVISILTLAFIDRAAIHLTGSATNANIIILAVWAQFFTNAGNFYLTFYRNSENASQFARYTIIGSILNFMLSIIWVVFIRVGVIGLVYAHMVSGAIIFCMLSLKFIVKYEVSFKWNILLESLKISLPLTPRIFIGVVSTQFDKYMVGKIGTIGGAGIYSLGQRFSYLVFSYMTALENVFSPQVYKKMFDMNAEGGKTIGEYLTPFAYISVLAAFAICLFSEEVIRLILPSNFHGVIDILTVLTLYYSILFFGKINGMQLIYKKKTHITSFITFISLVINIALNIPFIMRWGAMGAAWATLIAGILTGLITFVSAQRQYDIKWEYSKIGFIYFGLFCTTIMTIYLRTLNYPYDLRISLKVLCFMSYLAYGVYIQIVTKENLLIVCNIFRKKSVAGKL